MTNLFDLILQNHGLSDDVIVESSSERLTLQDIRRSVHGTSTSYRDRTIAIKVSSPIKFVETLIRMDGWARSVTLIAPTMPDALTSQIMSRAEAETLITDETEESHINDEWSERSSSDWLLTTSGTTGLPKIVRHRLESLIRTVKKPLGDFEKPAWGLLYDPSRFAGLQVVLQAVLGGGRLIVPDPQHDLETRIALFKAKGCSHLSATPSLWRKILMTPNSDSLALKQITIGGEIADQNLLNALSARFPGARISHIYASTELGVGFAVNDKLAGFPASYLQPKSNQPSFKIVCNQLWAKPAAQGNHGDASHIVRDQDGYISTGDLVELKGDRVFFVGRESSAVNIGGVKINLEDVEQRLLLYPAISACMVTARSNPILGSVLVFDVVSNDQCIDPKIFVSTMKAWCRENLQREAYPAKINLVSSLETTATGKIRRSAT